MGTWDDAYVEIDESDEIKFDLIPEGQYAGTIQRMTTGKSKKGDPNIKLDCRVVSENPAWNNTCLYVWYTFAPKAINIARQQIRAVLGDEKLSHGQKITGPEFIELVKEMQWETYPDDNPNTGTLRDLLFTVTHRKTQGYGTQNNLSKIGKLPDGWEEPDEADSEWYTDI